jgi:hypothetical protein
MAGVNAALNRDIWRSWEEALRAVETIASRVRGIPPKPAFPAWLWSERAEQWVDACIATAAAQGDDPHVANAIARAKAMREEWELLPPETKATRAEIRTVRELHALAGLWPDDGEPYSAYFARVVATGKIDPADEATWRDRLGLPLA